VVEVSEGRALELLSLKGAAYEPGSKPPKQVKKAADVDQPDEEADREPFLMLDLPESLRERMIAAGWETIEQVLEASKAEGGLAAAEGIGPVKAEQILEEIEKYQEESSKASDDSGE
jgi:hypothetical protein